MSEDRATFVPSGDGKLSTATEEGSSGRSEYERRYIYYDPNSGKPKVNRRPLTQNPWPFIGLGLTIGALVRGLRAMRMGDREMQQKMMRARVGLQAVTIITAIWGFRAIPLSEEAQRAAEAEFYRRQAELDEIQPRIIQ